MPRVDWNGDAVKRRMLEATRRGADVTTSACVRYAKPLTPVITATLQGSIKIEPATLQSDKVVARWGSFDVNYALYVEVGARGRSGTYMLRRAADAEYPRFAQNIRAQYRLTA